MVPLFAFLLDSPVMMLVLGAIAVMLFGERLPEVARTFGKSLMELKSGVRNLQQEFESAVNSATSVDTTPRFEPPEDREEATAPKFDATPFAAPFPLNAPAHSVTLDSFPGV